MKRIAPERKSETEKSQEREQIRQALDAVISALRPLDDESRTRVVRTACTFYEINAE